MNATLSTPAPPLAADKDARIDQALLELMGRGEPITHDAVAAQSGVSRRTVYRRFADQRALRQRVWELLSPPRALAADLDGLLGGGLADQFRKFDEQAAAMTVTMASAEGRAMRNQLTAQRTAYYRSVYGQATARLDEPLRTQVIAVLQLLSSGLAWREMRDQWGLGGEEIAAGCIFAIRAVLAAAERDAP